VGAFFLLAGISKFTDLTGTAGYIDSVGLPMASVVALLVAIFETVAGLALIVGKYTKHAALLLAGFTLVAAVLFHGPNTWETSAMQQLMFMKNMAITGGLLFMSAHLRSECHSGHSVKEETAQDDTSV